MLWSTRMLDLPGLGTNGRMTLDSAWLSASTQGRKGEWPCLQADRHEGQGVSAD
jgi:hypothetical protein